MPLNNGFGDNFVLSKLVVERKKKFTYSQYIRVLLFYTKNRTWKCMYVTMVYIDILCNARERERFEIVCCVFELCIGESAIYVYNMYKKKHTHRYTIGILSSYLFTLCLSFFKGMLLFVLKLHDDLVFWLEKSIIS